MSKLYLIRFCKLFWWQRRNPWLALWLVGLILQSTGNLIGALAAGPESVVTKEGKFGRLGIYIKKASEKTAATVKLLRQFVSCFSHVEEFKIGLSPDKKLVLSMRRSQSSQICLDKVEKLGVKVKSLDFDKEINLLASGNNSSLALSDIQGIQASLSAGQMETQISVRRAILEKQSDGNLLFKTEVSHKSIPFPIPLAVPLTKRK